ncbi:MAG: hypothetical protein H0X02_05065 [Nitrosomonas sp.]|nr:hypothetical protein [Nitrosomonas sp.]
MQFKKRNKLSADKVIPSPFKGSDKVEPKPFEGSEKAKGGELAIKANLAALKKAPKISSEKVAQEDVKSANLPSDAYKERMKKRFNK